MECLEAVLEEAARLGVVVHRVSQGSGVGMMTDAELDWMAAVAWDAQVEVSLFTRPNAGWGPSVAARAGAGGGPVVTLEVWTENPEGKRTTVGSAVVSRAPDQSPTPTTGWPSSPPP